MSEFTTTVNGHLSIVGHINTKRNLRGNMARDDNLRGNISTQGNMVGMMFAELYMNGLLNNPLNLKGSMQATQHLKGFATASMAYSDLEVYDGAYEVTPTAREQILHTKHKKMEDDVTVHKTPYSEVSNEYGGYTVTIL